MMYYLSLLGFFAIFSTTISKNPVLPLFSHAIGADDAVLGLIAAFSPLAGILFSFPVGVLSDYLGRKRLLVLSGVIFLCAPFLYLLVTEPVFLIPVRFFHGMATAILGPVISAVIAERFPDSKGSMLGQYSSATLVGRTIAPLAGGMILGYFAGTSGLLPYHVVYILAGVAAVPVFLLLLMYREDTPGSLAVPGATVFRDDLVRFFENPRLRATAFVDMATYFAFGAVETFLPVFLLSIGIGAFLTGVIFAVQVVVIAGTKPFFGKLADRFDKRIQILAGLLVLGVSCTALPAMTSFYEFLGVSAVFGIGLSLSSVATSAYVADLAEKDQLGAAMGALSSTMDIGQTLGPVASGFIITLAGYTAGFFASCLFAIIVAGIFVVSVRKDPAAISP
ncbi:MAG: MFS transporter [Methanoregulaceae archaeon]